MGRIVHGNKNFGYAPIQVDDQGNYSFGEVTLLNGMVSSSMEVEQEDTSVYADDKVYCMIKGAKARSAEVVLRYIPEAYAQYLGFKLNESGMLTDTGTFPNHCLFFESEEEDCDTGISTTTLHYLYNVKGSEPSKETATDEEEIEAQEITVSYKAMESTFVVDDDGNYVQYAYITRTDENAAVYDTFKTTVLLPSEVQPDPPVPQYEYVEVTPVGTENPSEEGWYELVNDEYVPTEDTEVNSEKTYYERREIN